MSGLGVSAADAELLMDVPRERLPDLAAAADAITRRFNGPSVDVEQLANIRRNSCTEDCSFCAQSAFYRPGRERFGAAARRRGRREGAPGARRRIRLVLPGGRLAQPAR